jgi:hypothetical protein
VQPVGPRKQSILSFPLRHEREQLFQERVGTLGIAVQDALKKPEISEATRTLLEMLQPALLHPIDPDPKGRYRRTQLESVAQAINIALRNSQSAPLTDRRLLASIRSCVSAAKQAALLHAPYKT